jgi:hypothetical protein
MAKRNERAEGVLTPKVPAKTTRSRARPAPHEPQRRPMETLALAALMPFTVTTVRIRPTHWRALHEEALRRAGTGKRADASAVLRDLLDEWLARQRR